MTTEKSAAQQFADLQRLKVQEAADYLKGRGQLTQTFSWQDLWHEEHGQQFTVSRLARLDILKAVQDGITQSVEGDLSRRDWTRNIKDLLKKEGWWGDINVLDPVSGETVVTRFDNARLKLIFDTNTRMAYSAGDWERIWRNRETHPYVRYITRGDEKVRATHRVWNNLVLPADHPFWEKHWPPNAWRCRCRVVSLTQAEYDKGYSETRAPYEYNPDGTVKKVPGVERVPFNKEAPPERFVEWTNKRTGEVSQVPVGIAPGFDYNPGLARTRQAGLEKVAREKLATAPSGLAKAAVSDGMNIARAVEGQQTWSDLGMADLRAMADRAEPAPELLGGAADKAAAVEAMRRAMGIEQGGGITVSTPVERVEIDVLSLPHVVEKRADQRERFANFVLPTLLRPTEVWAVAYDDGSVRNRYVKLFSGSRYDLLVLVKVAEDGSVFWNMMQRDRKGMNALRIGDLVYGGR